MVKKLDRNAAREAAEREQKTLAAKRSKISMSLEAILTEAAKRAVLVGRWLVCVLTSLMRSIKIYL